MARHEEGTLQRALSEFGDKQHILLTEVSGLQPTEKTSRPEQCLWSGHGSGQWQELSGWPSRFHHHRQQGLQSSQPWRRQHHCRLGFCTTILATCLYPSSQKGDAGGKSELRRAVPAYICEKWLKQASVISSPPSPPPPIKEEPKDFIFSLKWFMLAGFVQQ